MKKKIMLKLLSSVLVVCVMATLAFVPVANAAANYSFNFKIRDSFGDIVTSVNPGDNIMLEAYLPTGDYTAIQFGAIPGMPVSTSDIVAPGASDKTIRESDGSIIITWQNDISISENDVVVSIPFTIPDDATGYFPLLTCSDCMVSVFNGTYAKVMNVTFYTVNIKVKENKSKSNTDIKQEEKTETGGTTGGGTTGGNTTGGGTTGGGTTGGNTTGGNTTGGNTTGGGTTGGGNTSSYESNTKPKVDVGEETINYSVFAKLKTESGIPVTSTNAGNTVIVEISITPGKYSKLDLEFTAGGNVDGDKIEAEDASTKNVSDKNVSIKWDTEKTVSANEVIASFPIVLSDTDESVLTVLNNNGCTATAERDGKSNSVNLALPTVTVPKSGCVFVSNGVSATITGNGTATVTYTYTPKISGMSVGSCGMYIVPFAAFENAEAADVFSPVVSIPEETVKNGQEYCGIYEGLTEDVFDTSLIAIPFIFVDGAFIIDSDAAGVYTINDILN